MAYTAGQGLLVPRLVDPDGIRPLFGRVQTVAQAGGIVGSLTLSGLLAAVAAPLVWLGSAFAYVASALAQRGIHPLREAPPAPRESLWSQARAGIRHLLEEPTLRTITIANALNNAAVAAANTLVPVIALADLVIPASHYALLGVISGVAGIGGAAVASPLTARMGLRRVRVLSALGLVLGVLAVSGAVHSLPGPALAWIGAQTTLAAFCGSLAMVAGADLPARLAPADRLGVVMGAQRSIVLGAIPVTALVIGVLGDALGTEPTAWIWLAVALSAAVPCLRLPRSAA